MLRIFASIVPYDLGIGQALLNSLIGFTIVFFMLLLLYFVVKVIPMFMRRAEKAPEASTTTSVAVTAPTAVQPAVSGKVPAAGSLGEIALHDVPEKTAALVMAIIADELKTPLNELRFKSIKRVN